MSIELDKKDLYVFTGTIAVEMLTDTNTYMSLDVKNIVRLRLNEIWLYITLDVAINILNEYLTLYNGITTHNIKMNKRTRKFMYFHIEDIIFTIEQHSIEAIEKYFNKENLYIS